MEKLQEEVVAAFWVLKLVTPHTIIFNIVFDLF